MIHRFNAQKKVTATLMAWALMSSGCVVQTKPQAFELVGHIRIEGTAYFQQTVLVDGQGKKRMLDCTGSAATALQCRRVQAKATAVAT